ncbi:hypothetical protein J0S82_019377 [Galemys pyrenaicus]|uniref:Uncharacterized protein n=1 Tax=Galemys pyrenaicus TaxID=202257 RepID=A0A8J6DH10_GALPY|nr:hypothetical protein J0S82_019377 [Galemys pyrenaicus]
MQPGEPQAALENPKVFFHNTVDREPLDWVSLELFADKVAKTAEDFCALSTGGKRLLVNVPAFTELSQDLCVRVVMSYAIMALVASSSMEENLMRRILSLSIQSSITQSRQLETGLFVIVKADKGFAVVNIPLNRKIRDRGRKGKCTAARSSSRKLRWRVLCAVVIGQLASLSTFSGHVNPQVLHPGRDFSRFPFNLVATRSFEIFSAPATGASFAAAEPEPA